MHCTVPIAIQSIAMPLPGSHLAGASTLCKLELQIRRNLYTRELKITLSLRSIKTVRLTGTGSETAQARAAIQGPGFQRRYIRRAGPRVSPLVHPRTPLKGGPGNARAGIQIENSPVQESELSGWEAIW
jgi:hypothetical protein